jgi:hypothetical protein
MKTTLSLIATLVVFLCAAAPQSARADSILVEVEFGLFLHSGADILGLDGADVQFIASFDTATQYTNDCCANPQANAVSHKVIITGASMASSNGTFTALLDAAFFPTTGFLGVDGNLLDLGPLGSIALYFGGAIPQAAGDVIEVADFDTPLTDIAWVEQDTFYEEVDPSVTVTLRGDEISVPAPASGLLLLGGLAGLGYIRRRKAV